MIIFDCTTKQYGCLSEWREKGVHWLTTAGFTWKNKEFHASLRDCKCKTHKGFKDRFSVSSYGQTICFKNVEMKCTAVTWDTRELHSKLFCVRELINASNFMGILFLRLVWHEKFSFVYVEQNHFPCSRSRPQLTVKFPVNILHICQELSKSPNHNIWLTSKPHHAHIN